MYIKNALIKPRTWSTGYYGGSWSLSNLIFYDKDGNPLTNTNATYITAYTSATFNISDTTASILTKGTVYGSGYGVTNALNGPGGYFLPINQTTALPENIGLFIEFQKAVNVSKISFSNNNTSYFGNGWDLIVNNEIPIVENLKTTTAVQTISIDLQIETFERKDEPGVVYYIDEDI